MESNLIDLYQDLSKQFVPDNTLKKDSVEWYDHWDKLFEKSKKLKWFAEYSHLALMVSVFDNSVPNNVDFSEEVYVSSESFPTDVINYHKPEESTSTTNYNVYFEYTAHYGSSALVNRTSIHPVAGCIADVSDYEDEVKNFITFFKQLGKKVCIIHDYTYDSTVQSGTIHI